MVMARMDKSLDTSSTDNAQRLLNKNDELEIRRQRSAQASSDPNIWQQIRENYEAIILEHQTFSEKHEIEYRLWLLHYRRIEELRGQLNASRASTSSGTSQGGKVSARPDRIAAIRSQFKNFLSEATGFYHDLMLKIRSKYGLLLEYVPDDSESQMLLSKDANKFTEMKKGLLSCHRCMIYLGDLSRYKSLYGEVDSKNRDFAAASSYYMQACSLWPSSGNPHHQLAILASYTGDEFLQIYRYFRSLAIDNPCATARDNLIVAFEKNRQNFSHFFGDGKSLPIASGSTQMNGKERGKLGAVKDNKLEASSAKKSISGTPDVLKNFSIRFVRLNGILFTRTSLEMFGKIFSVVRGDLLELLSSGPEEDYKYFPDAANICVLIVRLIAILIFSVHNVSRESENQSYAEILQRSGLLQNAFTSFFDFMGLIIEKCLDLHDPSGNSLLPGIMIFMEWLASHPDIAAGREVEEKQAAARSLFWKSCLKFMNKLLSGNIMPFDEDKDEICFSNPSRYDEEETANRLALWEDFELRGFLPLAPAQSILDFSRKQTIGSDGSSKLKKSRLQRIIAAGKALVTVIQVGGQSVYFDSKGKEFCVGIEPEVVDYVTTKSLEVPLSNGVKAEHSPEPNNTSLECMPSKLQLQMADGEEEDEEIVFKPTMTDKRPDINNGSFSSKITEPFMNASQGDVGNSAGFTAAAYSDNIAMTAFDANTRATKSPSSIALHPHPTQPSSSKWLGNSEFPISNGLRNLNLSESRLVMNHEIQENVGVMYPSSASFNFPLPENLSFQSGFSSKVSDSVIPSKLDSVVPSKLGLDNLHVKSASVFPGIARKNPVSRPTRHVGPPPGFSPVPKPAGDSFSGISLNGNPIDDYRWLDGYQLPSSSSSSSKSVLFPDVANYSAQPYHNVTAHNSMTEAMNFPFPGKQLQTVQPQMDYQRIQQQYQNPDHLRLYQEMKQQQVGKTIEQTISMPQQYKGVPPGDGRFLV